MTSRPTSFCSFHGQSMLVNNLRIAVKSARAQGKSLGHILLAGPAGLGKTTLASSVLPAEMGVECQAINCAALESGQDLTNVLARSQEGTILFLDEIHMTPVSAREHLLTAMEDSAISVRVGEPPDDRVLRVELPQFTIIGATTRPGVLDAPLRSRFQYALTLQAYSEDEMCTILEWHAQKTSVSLDGPAASLIARASHGVARTGVMLLECGIDGFWAACEEGPVVIDQALAQSTLDRLGYCGPLSPEEHRYLMALARQTRPIGVKALSVMLDEHEQAIEDIYEPWLLRQGLITRGASGREITEDGRSTLQQVEGNT